MRISQSSPFLGVQGEAQCSQGRNPEQQTDKPEIVRAERDVAREKSTERYENTSNCPYAQEARSRSKQVNRHRRDEDTESNHEAAPSPKYDLEPFNHLGSQKLRLHTGEANIFRQHRVTKKRKIHSHGDREDTQAHEQAGPDSIRFRSVIPPSKLTDIPCESISSSRYFRLRSQCHVDIAALFGRYQTRVVHPNKIPGEDPSKHEHIESAMKYTRYTPPHKAGQCL